MNAYIKKYVTEIYGPDYEVYDHTHMNEAYDELIRYKTFNMSIEIKEREFNTKDKELYLADDILVEQIQTLSGLRKRNKAVDDFSKLGINNYYNAVDIHKALGWLYKCEADRLLYFKQLLTKNNPDQYFIKDPHFIKEVTIYDIDFPFLKLWLFNNMKNFQLNWCGATTGTINIVVPVKEIPKSLIYIKTYRGDEVE